MRFHEKHFEIPQVCLDLGFEDRSHHNEQPARMYNPQLDLTLWVNKPSAGKKRQRRRKLIVAMTRPAR